MARLNIQGPDFREVDRSIKSVQKESEGILKRILRTVGEGAVRAIKLGYNAEVYQGPLGAFGYPKKDNQRLAQSVQIQNVPDGVDVVTNQAHATFVEFGTGLFNTVGPRQRIYPRRANFLRFPVWRLPPGAEEKIHFVPRDKAKGRLPSGAIGEVFARSVKGMQAQPVWYVQETIDAINQVATAATRNEGFR